MNFNKGDTVWVVMLNTIEHGIIEKYAPFPPNDPVRKGCYITLNNGDPLCRQEKYVFHSEKDAKLFIIKQKLS